MTKIKLSFYTWLPSPCVTLEVCYRKVCLRELVLPLPSPLFLAPLSPIPFSLRGANSSLNRKKTKKTTKTPLYYTVSSDFRLVITESRWVYYGLLGSLKLMNFHTFLFVLGCIRYTPFFQRRWTSQKFCLQCCQLITFY